MIPSYLLMKYRAKELHLGFHHSGASYSNTSLPVPFEGASIPEELHGWRRLMVVVLRVLQQIVFASVDGDYRGYWPVLLVGHWNDYHLVYIRDQES